MHTHQIKGFNSVLFEEGERKKRNNYLLIFKISILWTIWSYQDEDQNGSQFSEKVASILISIGVEVSKIEEQKDSSRAPKGRVLPQFLYK